MKKEKSTDGRIEGNNQHKRAVSVSEKGSTYYCPMHCEGDKVYDAPGSCPVCGMFLVATKEPDTEVSQNNQDNCCGSKSPEATESQ
ncbi:heavy metal-binding domain-containing protein, partial [Sphingobacterium spiritivorum]